MLLGVHQADHIKLRSEDGRNRYKNLDFKHPFCNRHKGRLEGLIKSFSNKDFDTSRFKDLQLPQPRPDVDDILEQLTFDFN